MRVVHHYFIIDTKSLVRFLVAAPIKTHICTYEYSYVIIYLSKLEVRLKMADTTIFRH